jgi:catechol 2,3-dioxygenase-like lactoylglutathione lyase family enzyme
VFDHVAIRVSDSAASEQFYEQVFRAAGDGLERNFFVIQFSDEHPVTRDAHVAFAGAAEGDSLVDPDGNSVDVTANSVRPAGSIDRLELRVSDLEASTRFYETIAPYVDLGSLALVSAEAPTRHLHFAFPALENATVEAFHAAAVAAGYRDNGGPGERPVYHPGYYAAFVLDPDGNNVEVVNHNR